MKWLRRLLDRPRYHELVDRLTRELRDGDAASARGTAEACVALVERGFGTHHPELIAPLYALASARLADGDGEGAALASERALAIARSGAVGALEQTPAEASAGPGRANPRAPRARGPTGLPLHQLLEQRAAIAAQLGDDHAYEDALRRVLDTDDARARAAAHNRLGLFLAEKERFDESRRHFERALAHYEQLPNTDRLLAEVLHNEATLRGPEGDRERAASAFERALDLTARHLDPRASELEARIAHNFAALREEEQRIDDAIALYRRALAAFERDHAPDDAALRPTLARLGRLLQSQRRFDAALPILRRAHAIATRELGEENVVTGRLALWLGDANSATYR